MWVKRDPEDAEKDSFILELLFILLCGISLSIGVALSLKFF